MVLEKGVPFKFTLHPPLLEDKCMLSIPLSITAVVVSGVSQHRLDIHVPSDPSVSGLEFTNVEFLTSVSKKEPFNLKQDFCSDGVLGYLFMQLLDGQGRPSSLPFAIACCDLLKKRGGSSPLRLPLQADQRVRFYLVQMSGLGDGVCAVEGRARIEGLRFTGKVQPVTYGARLRSRAQRHVQDLMQMDLKFEADLEDRISPTDTRDSQSSRSPQEKTVDLRRKRMRAENSPRDSVDEKVPRLIYAFVPGGDDES